MRTILFLLLLPCLCFSQTVHLDKDQIVYKGHIKLDSLQKNELYARVKVLLGNIKDMKHEVFVDAPDKGEISAYGTARLHTPYSMIRKLHYTISVKVEDKKYQYQIDSVYIEERVRGRKTKFTSSEDLVKSMDITGPVAAQTEKLLNEIDMNFEMLLDLLKKDTVKK